MRVTLSQWPFATALCIGVTNTIRWNDGFLVSRWMKTGSAWKHCRDIGKYSVISMFSDRLTIMYVRNLARAMKAIQLHSITAVDIVAALNSHSHIEYFCCCWFRSIITWNKQVNMKLIVSLVAILHIRMHRPTLAYDHLGNQDENESIVDRFLTWVPKWINVCRLDSTDLITFRNVRMHPTRHDSKWGTHWHLRKELQRGQRLSRRLHLQK
jgi:hypothetical protein